MKLSKVLVFFVLASACMATDAQHYCSPDVIDHAKVGAADQTNFVALAALSDNRFKGANCLAGEAKDGTVTITTAGSANVLAAGDYIQTKTGSGFASTGAKRLSICLTWTVN